MEETRWARQLEFKRRTKLDSSRDSSRRKKKCCSPGKDAGPQNHTDEERKTPVRSSFYAVFTGATTQGLSVHLQSTKNEHTSHNQRGWKEKTAMTTTTTMHWQQYFEQQFFKEQCLARGVLASHFWAYTVEARRQSASQFLLEDRYTRSSYQVSSIQALPTYLQLAKSSICTHTRRSNS
ncbi:hypothetical protein P3342_001654 [Pyrenophora teres f. teres]|nr:hypothetical protein P3342_001654 [Pyrenophora teres f. teres]